MLNFLWKLIILSMSVSLKKTGANQPIFRIINGWEGKPGEVPYQVAFKKPMRNTRFVTFCGGSIIAANKILSAAHCFVYDPNFWQILFNMKRTPKSLSGVYAVAGTVWNTNIEPHHNSEKHGQWRTIRSVRYLQTYNFPTDDISIAIPSKPFVFNKYVDYIPYTNQHTDYTGTCLTSGFGLLSRQNEFVILPDKLMLANVVLIPSFECSKNLNYDTRKFICISPEPSSTAPGDSGGPLVCQRDNSSKGVLVGVTCGRLASLAYTYKVFTRISIYNGYIHKNVNGVDSIKIMKGINFKIKNYIMYLIYEVFVLLF